jgi:hypothetical protein
MGRLVSHSFLLGKADHLDRERQPDAVAVQMLHTGNAQQYSQRTIEFARVAHRVEMRPEQENLPVARGGRVMADNVANGIFAHRHARLAHPGANQRVHPAHRG